jgi:hypothetical protein
MWVYPVGVRRRLVVCYLNIACDEPGVEEGPTRTELGQGRSEVEGGLNPGTSRVRPHTKGRKSGLETGGREDLSVPSGI